tara:strand:+ start:462 stop:626 length:165 start_codon:yes stop_codon:yes gene_type:complete
MSENRDAILDCGFGKLMVKTLYVRRNNILRLICPKILDIKIVFSPMLKIKYEYQ